ncbi:MAG: glycosyltransferase family 39 protein [Candidatus Solibacter sp.]
MAFADESSKPRWNLRVLGALALLLCLAAALDTFVAFRMSATTDEKFHVSYGRNILRAQPDRLPKFNSQMPVSVFNAMPGAVASYLDDRKRLPRVSSLLNSFRATRFATIFATLLLSVFIFLWVSELYGTRPALAACLLATLSPSLIAHGTLATTDMYHAVGVVGALYFVRRYFLRPSWLHMVLGGVSLALAQLTKPFALSLYAVVAIVMLCAAFRLRGMAALRRRNVVVFAVTALLFFVVVINLAYSFDRTFIPIRSYRFDSNALVRLQQLPVLRDVPVPLPYPFLQGIDMIKHHEEAGISFGNIYMLGQLGNALDPAFHGFKLYYAVAVFFKEPIALQILFVSGLIWIWRRRSLEEFLFGEGLLLGAAGFLFIWFSFFSRAQIGIRHILPALAVEIIIAGAAFHGFSTMPRPKKAVLTGLVAWLAISAGSYFPDMIPYMNEWNYDRRYSYRILADSNLDWLQNEAEVRDFLRKNKDVTFNPTGPASGRILVSANRLTGVDRWHPSLTWIAKRYRPVAHVGYAHFLFIVPAEDVTKSAGN